MLMNRGSVRASAVLVAASFASVGFVATAAQALAGPGGGYPAGVTLWHSKSGPCPPTVSTSARPGAVVRGPYSADCQRLQRLLMTVRRPLAAQASVQPGGGGWEVDLTLNPRQRREFARVTRAEVGHELAIVVDGQLLSAPTVMDPITSGEFQITGLTHDFAEHLARRLNDSD